MAPLCYHTKDMTAINGLGTTHSCDTQDFLYDMACQTQMWSAPMREHVAKLKLNVLPLVQTTHGFGNPCYSERLGEFYPISTKLVDIKAVMSLAQLCYHTNWQNCVIIKQIGTTNTGPL